MNRLWLGLAGTLAVLAVLAPVAAAKERVLTLYSPRIDSLPYVHDTHEVALRANGREAPAEPGYLLGLRRWRWSTPSTPSPSSSRSPR